MTTTSETAFKHSPESIYDFVTNPENWTKTYPGSAHVGSVSNDVPLRIGDIWTETGSDGERIFTWHLAIAVRPKMWVFNSVGKLGHDASGNGGVEGRISVHYQFTRPGKGITLFARTMIVEAYEDTPLPDTFFRMVNPASIDRYHQAIARELATPGA